MANSIVNTSEHSGLVCLLAVLWEVQELHYKLACTRPAYVNKPCGV